MKQESQGSDTQPPPHARPAYLHTLVFDSLEEQIAVIDQAGAIIDVNRAWTSFGADNGLSTEYVSTRRNYLQVLSAAAAGGDALAGEAAQGLLDIVSGRRASFYFEYPCHSPHEKRWFMMRVTRLRDGAGGLFVISHQNITLRKLAEERAEHLAMHDPVTGLANRRYFDLILDRETRRSLRNKSAISLALLDVDHFKEYNDAFGHLAGDRCLIEVGRALQAFSRRPGDLAARLGGDEFALLLADTDAAELQRVAQAALKAINGLKTGEAKQVTASIGAACVVPHEQHGEAFLLQEADKALYRAKAAGRNRVMLAAQPG